MINGLDKWFKIYGVPPVEAGEPLKTAIKRGDYPADYQPKGRNTRGQSFLVPLPPDREFNLKRPFVLYLAADYCRNLDPPVEDGTLGQRAVLGFLQERRVFSQLANVYLGKLQRLTNNQLVAPCRKQLNTWVREGDDVPNRLTLYI